MLEAVRRALGAEITAVLDEIGVPGAAVAIEIPPRRELGDLAWAGALPLARALKRPPRAIADDVVARLQTRRALLSADHPLAWLEPGATVEGPGFVNFRIRRGRFLAHLLGAVPHSARLAPMATAATTEKVIVEHTNINPNKAAHIGHLRNAVLGDTLVRCLRWLGVEVEVQNYVDDTGVQVADVVVGFLYPAGGGAARGRYSRLAGDSCRRQRRAGAGARGLCRPRRRGHTGDAELGTADLDDLCWDLYPCVTRWYERDETATAHRAAVLHAVEHGFPPELPLADAVAELSAWLATGGGTSAAPQPAVARFAAAVAEGNLRCHLITMGRLGVAYDVLPHESDILHRGFWRRAFDLLQKAGAIRLESEGKNAGCWVMSLVESPEFAGMADADKILVRSNGTVTYTGKDIAYQLWKLGLLRDDDGRLHDFGYREFARFLAPGPAGTVRYGDGESTLFRSTPTRPSARRAPSSVTAAAFTTSSTRASRTRKRWSRRRSASSGTRRRPRARSTSPTRWSP